MRCPGAYDWRFIDVKFGNSTSDAVLSRQIGSDAGGVAALGDRGACGRIPGNSSFRETTKGEGESGGGLHLDTNAGGEEDAGS